MRGSQFVIVLIETSWNVKMVSISTFFTFTRINRNIVECKGKRKYVQLRFPDVLIETSWNVKRYSYTSRMLTNPY